MTDETRETLDLASKYHAAKVFLYREEGDAAMARKHERVRLAIEDVLTPRTCSTCRWVRHLPDQHFIGETEPVCANEDESHPLHWCSPVGNADTFGCNYWQAREGASQG